MRSLSNIITDNQLKLGTGLKKGSVENRENSAGIPPEFFKVRFIKVSVIDMRRTSEDYRRLPTINEDHAKTAEVHPKTSDG